MDLQPTNKDTRKTYIIQGEAQGFHVICVVAREESVPV